MNTERNKLVPVYYANGQLDAEMICAFLNSYEIEAFQIQESVGITYGLTLAPLGTAMICVREEMVDRAKEVLQKMEKGELGEADNGQGLA